MIELREGSTMGAMRVRHEPASAALVRHGLAADLTAQGIVADSVDEAVLVASELVGNAIRHAVAGEQGELDVRWGLDGDEVLISVGDRAPGRPTLRRVGVDAPSGRGLAIVDALARDWGVDEDRDGKRVWARLEVVRSVRAFS